MTASAAEIVATIAGQPSRKVAVRLVHDTSRMAAKLVGLCESQNWRCCYCGVVMLIEPRSHDHAASYDEVIPTSLGGSRDWDNQVAACRGCNTARGIMPASKFHWLVTSARGPGKARHLLARLAAAAPYGYLPHLHGGPLTTLAARPVAEYVPLSEQRRRYFELVYGKAPA